MNNISKIVLAIVAIVIIVLGIFAYMSLSQPRAQGTKNIYYIYEESERSAKPSNITRRG